MYEIGVVAQFEAAHRLVGDFGPATRLHGHTYRLEVEIRGENLQEDGTLFDIGRLRDLVDALTADLNYRNLDELPEFAGVNTTAENVASHCWDRLAADLPSAGLMVMRVRIWESPQVYAARDDVLSS